MVHLYLEGSTPVAEIIDNGIGIPEENLPNIFTRFKKFQESGNNFGLGLALVKKSLITSTSALKLTPGSMKEPGL
jgi:signal transduction histidine kinase